MKNENAPLVSIIVPVYNRKDLLPRTLASVINQTYKNLEIIVVDDGSSDDIKSVVDSFNDARIKYVRHTENKGLPSARNTGLKTASGDFIAFLDSDDEYLPEKTAKQIRYFLKQSNDVDMVYCGAWREYKGQLCLNSPYISEWNFLCLQIMIKSSVIDKAGFFDEYFIYGEDMDYMSRLKDVCKCAGFSEPLVIYHYTAGSIISNKLPLLKYTDKFLQKHHNRISYKEKSRWFYAIGQRYKRLGNILDAERCFFKAYFFYPLNWKALKKMMGLSPLLLFDIFKRRRKE